MADERLLVEGEERPLRAWDFAHCPPGTAHAFVGAGVETETSSGAAAYAGYGEWRLERPGRWSELPWGE